MAETKDGGPAFPAEGGYDSGLHPNPGMSLRDWFAGQALAGLGEWTPNLDDGSQLDWTSMVAVRIHRAEWAYAQADAMLAARKEGQGGGA